MVRQITQAGIAVLILIATCYTSTVSAHGKVEMEDDSCMRRIGENMIHLSVYQPQVDEAGHYCTDIPESGNAVMVIDLVDPALREMPIGIKLVKGSNEEDGEVLINIRPNIYSDGVINMQQMLEHGTHMLIVTADGLPPLNYKYGLRVEMINYEEVFRASIGPAVGILLTTILGYKILRSRRFKSWLAEKRGQEISSSEPNDSQEGEKPLRKDKKSSKEATGKKVTNKKETASEETGGDQESPDVADEKEVDKEEISKNKTNK